MFQNSGSFQAALFLTYAEISAFNWLKALSFPSVSKKKEPLEKNCFFGTCIPVNYPGLHVQKSGTCKPANYPGVDVQKSGSFFAD